MVPTVPAADIVERKR